MSAIGARVILQWMRFDPYPQAADLQVGLRFGEIVDEKDGAWIVRASTGDVLVIDASTRCERRDTDPRWVVQLPVPTYGVGERVVLRRSTRSAPPQTPQPDDRRGEIVDETPETMTIVDEAGERRVHDRINGHERVSPQERNRQRWVVVERCAR